MTGEDKQSEESIEAAAERVQILAEQGKVDPEFVAQTIVPFCDDAEYVASHLLARLARDLAEQAERAKPIDAEWCLAHGAATDDKRRFFRWKIGGVGIYWDARGRVEIEDILSCFALESIATRGQLEWLIRAVKGCVA